MAVDGWEEIILRWFHDPAKFSRTPIPPEPDSVFKGVRPFDGSEGVSTADVLEHAVGKLKGQLSPGDAQRVGRILKRLGLKRRQFRLGKIGEKSDREWRYVFSAT